MLLNEKQLEQTILDNIDFVPAGEPATVRIDYCKAARAIAEKLAEGVVPLGTGIFGYHYDAFHRQYAMIELDDALEIGLRDGQLVTVTVRTREESDGNH